MREIEIYNQHDFNLNNRSSGQVASTCPYCSQDRKKKSVKCVSINLDKNTWNCKNCEKSGTVHKYKSHKSMRTYTKPKQVNSTQLSDAAVKWFKGRGIAQWVLNDMKIAGGMEYMPQEEKEMNTIQFNYFSDGELVNIKYRDAKKNFKLFKDAELIPYNIDSTIGKDYVIICEGEIDCLSYVQCGGGVSSCISVPNGANKNLHYLDDGYMDMFEDKERVYLAVDNDDKGVLLRSELLRRFGAERCLLVDFKDCKDANEYLVKYGEIELEETIKDATEYPVAGVFSVNDFRDEFDSLYTHGLQRGMDCRIQAVDEFISFELGRMYTFVGIPGHGKSVFTDHLAVNLNIHHDLKFGMFSPEHYPLTVHAAALAEKFIGKSFTGEYQMSRLEYSEAKQHINDNFFWIMPEDETFSLDNILAKAKYLIKKKGIHCLVIDPFNKIEHHNTTGLSETAYIGLVLDKMLNFAHQNGIMIFLVVHPTKMKKKEKSILYEVPTLYDCMGSSNFYNKAEFGISVYRNFETKNTEIYFQKIKFKHLGEIGVAELRYSPRNGRFAEVAMDEPVWDNGNKLNLKKVPPPDEAPF